MSLLIRNCTYLVRNSAQIERDCDILTEGSRIKAIGKDLPHPESTHIIDATGCAVIPGLVNAHTHLYQNLLKGVSPNLTLIPWCNQVLFPWLGAMRSLKGEQGRRLAYLWTASATIEMIRGGTTCCVNMDTVSPGILPAWNEIGFRGVLAYTLANKWVPAELRAGEERMKQQLLDFIEEFHQPDGLITVMPAPSTLFLCTDDFLTWAGETGRRYDLGMQIHVAEVSSEVEDQLHETGHTPVEHLQHLGLLNQNLSAVHMVHVNEHDLELMAASGAGMVHCPKSNMKLADGIAPIMQMRQAGIPVSLGTDGCASNDLLDLWEEMRAGLLLARVSANDPDSLNPAEAFNMATSTAARVARVDAGELQEGKLADLAIVDLQGAHLRPLQPEFILNTLVFCARAADVRDTIINGAVVMRNRQLTRINEKDILEETDQALRQLAEMRQEQPT